MEYTKLTPNGEERCEILTTEEKLTRIKAHHMGAASCETCGLELGRTCPAKLWADWTDEEINTAYGVLTAKTAKDSLPNGDGMTIEEMRNQVADYCNSFGELSCGSCRFRNPEAPERDWCDWRELDNRSTEECYWVLVNEGLIDKDYKPPVNFVKVNADDEVEPENDAVESDTVNHPNHYTQNGIECIEAIRASMTADGFCDYCKGNIIKYIWRWRDKGGIEDLRKASVYLDWLIEEAESEH